MLYVVFTQIKAPCSVQKHDYSRVRLAVSYVVVVGSVFPVSHSPGLGTRRCLTKFTF